MELFKILVLFAVTFAHSDSWVSGGRTTTPTFMYFADGKGNIRPAIILKGQREIPPINEKEDVQFFVYTRESSTQVWVGDAESLHKSGYDINLPTFIVTHGYQSSVPSDTIQEIKDMYLSMKECNVIAIDWSGLASNVLYHVVKGQVKDVGTYVGKFIDFLVLEGNLDISSVHLAGHSLGAHVMGFAGKTAESGKVGRITGMDPAGPLFTLEEVDDRLAVGDAKFVDIIHTCAGIYGFDGPLGDVDFFPNGGHSRQPGCGILLGGACSHSRSWQFFTESISTDKFIAVKCETYENYEAGLCDDQPKASMGEPVSTSARGLYFLRTASESPFALG